MCANALRCCGESQHLGNGPPSLGAGWSTLSCPLIKPLIQGRHEKEPFWFETSHASQFFCKDIFQIPRIQLLCYPPGPPAGKFGFQMQLVKWLLHVVQPSCAKPYFPPCSTFRESFPKKWVRCLTRILRATRKDSKRSQKWNTGTSTFQKVEILGGNKV